MKISVRQFLEELDDIKREAIAEHSKGAPAAERSAKEIRYKYRIHFCAAVEKLLDEKLEVAFWKGEE